MRVCLDLSWMLPYRHLSTDVPSRMPMSTPFSNYFYFLCCLKIETYFFSSLYTLSNFSNCILHFFQTHHHHIFSKMLLILLSIITLTSADVDYDPFETAAKLNASLHTCYRNHVNEYPDKAENQGSLGSCPYVLPSF